MKRQRIGRAARLQIGGAMGGAVAVLLLQSAWAPTVAFAKSHVVPFINGSVAYVNSTSGPVVEGDQQGSGIGVEGVSDTGASAGAIAVQGFGTSTTNASVGVNGAVQGPGSTALIGNANATSGSPSIGLEGFSKSGEGVFAQSLSANFPSLRAVDANAHYDVRLSDVVNGNGITVATNTSASPSVAHGIAVTDTSPSGFGASDAIFGSTANGNYGVEGDDTATGFYGMLGYGAGSTFGGVDGEAASSTSFATGVFGLNIDSGSGVFGGADNGPGVEAGCEDGSSTDEFLGVSDTDTVNYSVNCSGHVTSTARTRHGMYARSFEAQDASMVLEDEGEARLVDGSARVTLDPGFAEAISSSTPYLVFVTPLGDTDGLYVADRDLSGFEVKEVRGGRSSIAFDYRLVAHPVGDDHERMVVTSKPRMMMRPPAMRMTSPRARALREANLYEPHFGPDGKLHSEPIRYTTIHP